MSQKIECDVVRNDGTDLSLLCHSEHSLANRARTYGRDWGWTFRREGPRFLPVSIADLARDGDAKRLGRFVPLLSVQSDPFLLLGDDQLGVAGPSPVAMDPEWAVASVVELVEALRCDEILRTRAGATTGPLAYSSHFDPKGGPWQSSPRFRTASAARANVVAALEGDVMAWMGRPGASMPRCGVTFSDAAIVSVLCSTLDAGAGFSWRLGDGTPIRVEELLARFPGQRHRLTRRCVDAGWPPKAVQALPEPTLAGLQAFALELEDVVFALPYVSADVDASAPRLALCRVSYRELNTSLAELGRVH